MNSPEWLKPGIYGALIGAVFVGVVGFTWGGWVTGGTANSESLKLTERLRRVDPEMIEYRVTVEDPVTLTAPFTMRLMLTTQPGYTFLEYSCHEGNGAVPNSLSGERAYERQVAEAVAEGLPAPRRATNHNEIRNGEGVDLSDPFDINAGE